MLLQLYGGLCVSLLISDSACCVLSNTTSSVEFSSLKVSLLLYICLVVFLVSLAVFV